MMAELLARLSDHDDRMERFLDEHVLLIEADAGSVHTKATQRRVAGRLQTTVIETTGDLQKEKRSAAKRDRENARTESPFAERNQHKYSFDVLPGGAIGFKPLSRSADTFEGEARIESGELVSLDMKANGGLFGGGEVLLKLRYDNKTKGGRNISSFEATSKKGTLTMKFAFE